MSALRLGGRLRSIGRVVGSLPGVAPVIPDPGIPFSSSITTTSPSAVVGAVLGRGAPGPYNIAADDECSAVRACRRALGWHSVTIPRAGVAAAAEVVARLPGLPAELAWIEAFRRPVLMDCSRARAELGWKPQHSSRETLDETIAGARESGLL